MRIRALTLVSATLVLGMGLPVVAQSAQATVPRGTREVHHSAHKNAAHKKVKPVLFGLNDHWENQIISDDSQDHARSGIVGTFLPWRESTMTVAGEASAVVHYSQWARSRGAIPMIDLYPPAGVTLAQIAAGDEDDALNLYAKDLAGWNHTFLLRLFPEMNGPWESYSPGYNGNTAAQFIAAWRHVYNLFHQDGASNVQFIWNPDKLLTPQAVSFARLWPGSQYVDWVGLDVYMNGANVKTVVSARAAALPSVQAIRRFTNKPLIIPEVGVSNTSRKAHWIANSVRGLASLGAKAIVWFNEALTKNTNWRFDSSSSALAAARRTLAGPLVAWPGHNGGSLTHDQALVAKGTW
jgi:Glycosyl hydrolase family 26